MRSVIFGKQSCASVQLNARCRVRALGSVAAIGVALLSAWGCRASANASAKSSGDAHASAEASGFDDMDERAIEDERGRVGEFAVPPGGGPVAMSLLGARHDLYLKGTAAQVCSCLSIAAGQPSDPRFGWEAQIPAINPARELVLAFRNESCAAATGLLGAAYRGYRTTETGDVVVMVEEAKDGRPRLYGAILPRPEGQGRLLIEPFPRTLPFGQPLEGKTCSVAF
jgi:hypothetical protein